MNNECIMSNELAKAFEEFVRKIAKEEIRLELKNNNPTINISNTTISKKDIDVEELIRKINTIKLGKII